MSRLFKRLIIGALAVSFSLQTFFIMPANARSSSQTALNTCGFSEYKPKRIFLACADGGEGVHSIKWTLWKSKKAEGKGTYYINNCVPSCVDGKYLEKPVRLFASRRKIVRGRYQFTRFVVHSMRGEMPYIGTTDIRLNLPRG
jgi:hypothetical protein